MKKVLFILFALMLIGCNPVKTFQEMTEKQAEFNQLSLKELGVEASVGWNIHNGDLTSVTVMYPEGVLGNLTVAELSHKTHKMVHQVFDDAPKSIVYGFQTVNQ